MFSFVHRLILSLKPETAHRVGVFFLKIYQRLILFFCRSQPSQSFFVRKESGSSIYFKKPLGLAAGFDKNAELFVALSHFGFGFVEVGTVTPKPQEGNPKPRLWRVEPEGLINQMGFNNCGLERFKSNLKRLRPFCSVPILANVGKNKMTPNEFALEDYQYLFTELEGDVDGFVVNVSSPNTEGLRDLQSISFLEKIESVIPEKPVWIKLAPDLEKKQWLELLAKVKESRRLSGVVLTNTSRAIASRDYHRETGGYSGEKLFEKSLECVALAREIFKGSKSIIGVGGVNSAARAQKMLTEGADLVEIYTGFVYQGPSLIEEISKSLINQSFELRF